MLVQEGRRNIPKSSFQHHSRGLFGKSVKIVLNISCTKDVLDPASRQKFVPLTLAVVDSIPITHLCAPVPLQSKLR